MLTSEAGKAEGSRWLIRSYTARIAFWAMTSGRCCRDREPGLSARIVAIRRCPEARFQVLLPEVRGIEPSRLICMPIRDEDILRILREVAEPLFASEITVRLNHEFGAGSTVDEVATRLTRFKDGIAQLPDGRWTLKRRLA